MPASKNDLQKILDRLLVTTNDTRQVHWNLVGRGFSAGHELLDDAYEFLNDYSDELAERMRALSMWPDGTVAREIPFESVPGAKPLPYIAAFEMLAKSYASLSLDMKTLAAGKAEDDLATQDLLIEGIREIDKFTWFFRMEAHD